MSRPTPTAYRSLSKSFAITSTSTGIPRLRFTLAAYVLWRINWIHPFADGNGRTARAVSYLVMCVKMGCRIPGVHTIPDMIAENKRPYYQALEAADQVWLAENRIDLSALEKLLGDLLAAQLVSALEQARGRPLA